MNCLLFCKFNLKIINSVKQNMNMFKYFEHWTTLNTNYLFQKCTEDLECLDTKMIHKTEIKTARLD